MKITIEIPNGFNARLIQQVMIDAFAEFYSQRTPAKKYVEKRYEGQSEAFKVRTVSHVLTRNMAASALHSASFNLTVSNPVKEDFDPNA